MVTRALFAISLGILSLSALAGELRETVEAPGQDFFWEIHTTVCEDLDAPDAEAIPACQIAVEIAKQFGSSDPRFARSLSNLTVRQPLDLESEEQIAMHAIETWRQARALGKWDPVPTGPLSGLASLRSRQNRIDEAIAAYREAIDVGIEQLGERHVEVAALRALLGIEFKKTGRLQEASEVFSGCFESASRHTARHREMALTLASACAKHLGEISQNEGRTEDAERYFWLNKKYAPDR